MLWTDRAAGVDRRVEFSLFLHGFPGCGVHEAGVLLFGRISPFLRSCPHLYRFVCRFRGTVRDHVSREYCDYHTFADL